MLGSIGQYVGGKVLSAVLIVAVGATGIWFWKHPEQLRAIGQVLKYVCVWLGLVLVLPWAAFPVTAWVVRKESNAIAAMLVGGLIIVDALFALYLADWGFTGALTWMVVLLGFLTAGVYNFVVCDFQADRLENSL